MRAEFLPFSRPAIDEGDIAAVSDVLRSGWITTGAETARFEAKFAAYAGCARAVGLCSATAGMHLVLKALGIGPGDEVITPSMTWVSTVNLIVLSGAVPVFADIDPDTLMVTSASMEACMSSRTRLMVPVHFAGAALALGALYDLAARNRIPMVEDAAHALGTQSEGKPVGGEGTSIFSFHPIKNITTGEGGMFCTHDESLADRINQLKFHGLGVDAFDRRTQGRAPQAQVMEPGFKYNMTDMAAALGLGQLARVDVLNEKRRKLAGTYRKRLSGVDEIRPLSVSEATTRHAWHLFVVRIDTDRAKMSRDVFMERLKERNIGTGLHFRAVHLQKYYREFLGTKRGMLPHTEWNSDRICSLPLFPDMTFEDVEDVVEAVKDVLSH
ncbi:MAG: DegT/DnrJ/EryC1/StrS family aminotransferase [Desulfatiglandaceae bacterium]